MKQLTIVLLALCLFSCGKDDDENENVTSDRFLFVQNHSWVRDSFYTFLPGDTSVAYATDAPDDTVIYRFTTDKYVFSDYFGNDTLELAYQNPDRIYFWSPDAQRNDSLYYQVLAVDNDQLIFKQIKPDNIQQVFYCHAR